MLCGDLNGEEIQKRGDMCVYIQLITLLYSRNQHTIVKQLYSKTKFKKKKKMGLVV